MKEGLTESRIKTAEILGLIVWIPSIEDEDDPEKGQWGLWHIINTENEYVDFENVIGPQFFRLEVKEEKFQKLIRFFIPKLKKLLISNKIRFKILTRDKFRCRYCGKGAIEGAVLEIDHIIPRSKGGDDSTSNLITSCRDCNRGKGKEDME